ncbi:helix-turn-helix transcriptional regulator [Puia dinghuensis]|uniref:AraC family transcriptional regulator n=1 Tax=Puia dinghuensis TaxID=1792502 RepID=A0A8J2U672_9BACT|nr:helix-turn-helix transcriptional regulator [Puia dinghuensis]GGA81617.1 AraC family transcriptional regulator [Puia dinghuensis]
MEFTYFPPSDILKPYIRHYYIFHSTSGTTFEDVVFPSGDMEMIFNLASGIWSTQDKRNPLIELWGQITKPLDIQSSGSHTMLGIKFFPHSAAYFLECPVGDFNDQVADLGDILGKPVKQLHTQLLATGDAAKRIALVESFLIDRLIQGEKRSFRIDKVGHILKSMVKAPAEIKLSAIATQHGITSRYLNKLVYQHTGLTPISFNKIRRFQFSLKLIAKNDQPFTAIAYDCGYFDQSHFIKEFKSFTGLTPSAYLKNISPVNQLLQQ